MKVTDEQEQKVDKRYILRRKKEAYGYRLLTDKIGFLPGKPAGNCNGKGKC